MKKEWGEHFNIGIFLKCPCKNCDKREVGCHSKCDKYQSFIKEKRAKTKADKKHREKLYGPWVDRIAEQTIKARKNK